MTDGWDTALSALSTASRAVAALDFDATRRPELTAADAASIRRARSRADKALDLLGQAATALREGRAAVGHPEPGGDTEAAILRRGAAAVRDPEWRRRFEKAAKEAESEGS